MKMGQETDLVAVAMSGGVDSSVAAHLLSRQGISCWLASTPEQTAL